jgi:hypothetical protein
MWLNGRGIDRKARDKMEKGNENVKALVEPSELIGRRSFLARGVLTGAIALAGIHWGWVFAAEMRAYKLAPESVLPSDIRQARVEVREAYRFAIANRDILRYIPCYCGCGSEGHTSNASCYVKDYSTPERIIFDRMSLG